MKIQVLGSGCPTCAKLNEAVHKAVEEMALEEKVEYLTGAEGTTGIIELGAMSSPVLAINDQIAMVGVGIAVLGGMLIQRLKIEKYIRSEFLKFKSKAQVEAEYQGEKVPFKDLFRHWTDEAVDITKCAHEFGFCFYDS